MVDRIHEMEPSERPRERLLSQGAGALSDAEILAILVRTGRRGHGAVDTARELLAEHGGLLELARADVHQLTARPGIGPAKAATLVAALELGRRLARAEMRRADRLGDPDAAGSFLSRLLQGQRREVFGFLSLDARHQLLADHELSRGTRHEAPVDPGELFHLALADRAAAVLAYHNHPSGRLEPSRDDLALTRRLVAAGGLLGVPLLDHLVIADSRWLSLRRRHPELFVEKGG